MILILLKNRFAPFNVFVCVKTINVFLSFPLNKIFIFKDESESKGYKHINNGKKTVKDPNTGKYIVRVVSGGYANHKANKSNCALSVYIEKGLGSDIKIGNNDRCSCGMLAAYANRVVRFHFEDVATSITAGTRTLTFVGRRVSGSSIYQHGTGQNSVAAVTFLSVDIYGIGRLIE
jgi:hypothetical protein